MKHCITVVHPGVNAPTTENNTPLLFLNNSWRFTFFSGVSSYTDTIGNFSPIWKKKQHFWLWTKNLKVTFHYSQTFHKSKITFLSFLVIPMHLKPQFKGHPSYKVIFSHTKVDILYLIVLVDVVFYCTMVPTPFHPQPHKKMKKYLK